MVRMINDLNDLPMIYLFIFYFLSCSTELSVAFRFGGSLGSGGLCCAPVLLVCL